MALTWPGDVPSSAFFQRGSKPLATTRRDSHLCSPQGGEQVGGGGLCVAKDDIPVLFCSPRSEQTVPPTGPPGRLQVSTDVRLQGPELSCSTGTFSRCVAPASSSASGSSLDILRLQQLGPELPSWLSVGFLRMGTPDGGVPGGGGDTV